jgi:hypothetical protein
MVTGAPREKGNSLGKKRKILEEITFHNFLYPIKDINL